MHCRAQATLTMMALSMIMLAAPAAGQPGGLTREQVEVILKTSRDLSRRNLSRSDLAGLRMDGVDLSGANLTEANLQGAALRRANLRAANLTGADLQGAMLERANLREAELTGANLTKANLVGANLTRARLRGGARLRGANLSRADLLSADLREADLQEATLTEAQLIRADLSGANLTEADGEGAILTGAVLAGANLTRANLRRSRLHSADLADANIDGTHFAKAEIAGVLNVEKAKNGDRAKWQESAPATAAAGAEKSEAPLPPPAARIYLKTGPPVDVDSWSEQGEMLFYSRAGVTHGVPLGDMAKIEDPQGKVLRQGSRIMGECVRPDVGEPESSVLAFFRCLKQQPAFRTRTRQGRQVTVYAIPSQAGGGYFDFYMVSNGRITQIETGGFKEW